MVSEKTVAIIAILSVAGIIMITQNSNEIEIIEEEVIVEEPIIETPEVIQTIDYPAQIIEEETLDCNTSCIDKGYISGHGPYETSQSCNFPEIPSSGVCCCLHEEFS